MSSAQPDFSGVPDPGPAPVSRGVVEPEGLDWARVGAFADRLSRLAGALPLFVGVGLSLGGALAAILILAAGGSMVVAGAAAAGGAVAGLLSSRKGLRGLRGEPLAVVGRVLHKDVRESGRRNDFLVVVEVEAAWALSRDGARVDRPALLGARTLVARQRVFDGLTAGEHVCLVCLANGVAVGRADRI